MAAPTRTDLIAYAIQAAQKNGLDPAIFVRQIDQESGFDPAAKNPSGATGIAQLMPQFYPNVDPTDPYASLDAAAQTDAQNLQRFGGNYAMMLAAYDAGAGAVEKAQGVPDMPETQAYVKNILGRSPGGDLAELTMGGMQDGPQGADPLTDININDIANAAASNSADATNATEDTATQAVNQTQPVQMPNALSPEELHGLIARHGGLLSPPTVANKTISSTEDLGGGYSLAGGKKTNPFPTITYHMNDHTQVTVEFDPTFPGSDGGWKVIGGNASVEGTAAGKQTTVGTNTNDPYIVTRDGNGNLRIKNNPNYVQKPGPTNPSGWLPFQGDTGQTIGWMDPATGKFIKAPTATTANTRPVVQKFPDGSMRQWNATTQQWDTLQGPDTLETALRQAQLAKAQQALRPQQQQLLDNAYQTIDAIKQRLASGDLQPSDAQNLMKEVWSGLDAGLQGTTLFEKQQADIKNKQALAQEGSSILRQQISSGSSLADRLLSAAVGHVLLKPGQTSLGIDPLAIANQEVQQLGGGPEVSNWAKQMLLGASASGTAPGMPDATSPYPTTREGVLAKYPELSGGTATPTPMTPIPTTTPSIGPSTGMSPIIASIIARTRPPEGLLPFPGFNGQQMIPLPPVRQGLLPYPGFEG